MYSLRELYRIGRGPSSSHTIGPERACKLFLSENKSADEFRVVLYGSLAKTGVGHGTDEVIKNTLPNVSVLFNATENEILHPNTMDIIAYTGGVKTGSMRIYSVGGGAFKVDGRAEQKSAENVYTLQSFSEIRKYCEEKNLRLSDYVLECEGQEVEEYLFEVWTAMKNAVERGVQKSGVLPGGLQVERKAKVLYEQPNEESAETRENRLICAYAFAVGEENASGGTIVTATRFAGSCKFLV